MTDILQQDIKYLSGIGPQRQKILSKELGISTYGDLLQHFPYKHIDRSKVYTIREMTSDMPFVQVRGRILSYETFPMGANRKRVVAHFGDGTGVMDLIWFSGGQYIMKTYHLGVDYIVFGRPGVFNGRMQITHPDIDPAESLTLESMGMQPYYHTTERMKKTGMTSRSIERYVKTLLQNLPPLRETLPSSITQPLHLMSRDEALRTIHYPHNQYELQHARERLKFEELFYVQLNILRYVSGNRRKYKGYLLPRVGAAFNDFYFKNLKFELTGAQKRVVREIKNDMNTGRQMNRLVQGDVGSGKTLVALMSMLIALDNGCQACLMAPTEILATQHFANFQKMLSGLGITVELLVGSLKPSQKKKIKQQLAAGEVDILIGTHALIEKDVVFKQLGYVVIDEQHRFGVEQRAKLWGKSDIPPHVLVMTATPIPRTLAMTLYADLDCSVIDELPPGRQPIRTTHGTDAQRALLFSFMKKQIALGRQIYVVYPLINESETLDLKDLMDGYESISRSFPMPQYQLSIVHGQMPAEAKAYEMDRFKRGETHIMVSTTVIEVGVDVPNATVMVIENAERFGLSQLHQLRGRVGRGGGQSYCILMTKDDLSRTSKQRIDTMCATTDGFLIAEADLKLRGPGDLQGLQQSGMLDMKVADLVDDEPLVRVTRDEIRALLESDPDLQQPDNRPLRKHIAQSKLLPHWDKIS